LNLDGVAEQYGSLKFRCNIQIDALHAGNDYQIDVAGSGPQSRINVTGLFQIGVNQSANSHISTSDATFLDIFARQRAFFNVGLIYAEPGTDLAGLAERFNATIPGDIRVVLLAELLRQERSFYEFQTPIGVTFRFWSWRCNRRRDCGPRSNSISTDIKVHPRFCHPETP
jgi:hypothetical protein